MSVVNFPLPDREYYAASPVLWDEPTISRPRRRLAPSRRRTRRSPLLLLALLGLALFLLGMKYGDRLEESILKGLNGRKGGKTK